MTLDFVSECQWWYAAGLSPVSLPPLKEICHMVVFVRSQSWKCQSGHHLGGREATQFLPWRHPAVNPLHQIFHPFSHFTQLSTLSLESPCLNSCSSSIFPSRTSMNFFSSPFILPCFCWLSSMSTWRHPILPSSSAFLISAAYGEKQITVDILEKIVNVGKSIFFRGGRASVGAV